tara:strand:+ start:259 stop:582 length:324 start_codon:yes stop_codon:yes gene_type:complete
MNYVTGIIAALVAVVVGLGAVLQREVSKRSRAEERSESLAKNTESAKATARVLHEIANETDEKLKAAQAELDERESQIEEAEEEVVEAADEPEKIAGLWNRTFGRRK